MRPIAIIAIVALTAGSTDLRLGAQNASTTSAGSPSEPIDGGWPRAYQSRAGAQIVIYQPQVASWDGRRQMVAYAAVSYQPSKADKPTLGTIAVEAATAVSLEERLVRFSPLQITQANFATLPREQIRDLIMEITASIPEEDRVIALDRVLANVDNSQILPKNIDNVKADPPRIFYSTKPAVLVNFDGEPIWSPIQGSDLKFAVNTNWDVFQLESSKTFYLRYEKRWLKASDVNGPWSSAATLPDSFSKLPADANWSEVKGAVPPQPAGAAAPSVFVSTQPAELILLRGEPVYEAVPGTQLMWVNNTENDLFRLGRTGPVYFLVSGRWFSALSFNGPWSFVTPTLPPDFKKISLEHPRSRVLASVPGTPQAAEAVLLAQVPQTARVNRKTLQAPEVIYQGDPVFDPIQGTLVSRAVNVDKDIIKVGDLYYMCFQGVWFMGRSPQGPWEVATSVPPAIYEIPVSSPAHHVTYVTVDNSDDEWVTFAAVAGYTGMMVGWGCAVWGTGWYYPPYVWYGGFYPIYYPFYPTYGYGAWYNPWTGGYGRAAAWYGPYGGAGVYARYNPVTGTYARGAVAWGPYGARGAAGAYNPRTGTYARTQQGAGIYGSWGSTSVQRGNQWAQTARVTNRATGTTTRVTQGSGGGAAITRNGPGGNNSGVARTGSGDIYAGRDGNVYRRQDGNWQKYDNGSWGSVNTPSPNTQQLDRDRAARAEGATRTRDYGRARSSGGGSRATGSYRPSGGMRGGGRRR
ncbi:MAG TPA: hypothetical protein VH417_19000 [Vicinamibacterales bacterium]